MSVRNRGCPCLTCVQLVHDTETPAQTRRNRHTNLCEQNVHDERACTCSQVRVLGLEEARDRQEEASLTDALCMVEACELREVVERDDALDMQIGGGGFSVENRWRATARQRFSTENRQVSVL